MMRTLAFAVLLSGMAAALVSCGSDPGEEPVTSVATVRTALASERTFNDFVVAYGSVELAPSHNEALTVQYESQVAEVLATSGAVVHKGDALLRVRGSVASTLEAEKARRAAEAARKEAARVARLQADGLATDSELQAARDAAATAAELHESLAARTGARAGVILRAPRNGIVDELSAQPGDVLAPGTVVARIVDTSAWQIRLGIEADDLGRVHAGQRVRLSGLTGSRSVPGTLRYVDERLDPTSHLASAIVVGQGVLGLPPGAAVRGAITVATHEHAISVPRSAVLYEGGRPYVFIVMQDKAQRRDVELGFQDDQEIEMRRGLRHGDTVVVLGNDELSDGMSIRVATDTGKRTAS